MIPDSFKQDLLSRIDVVDVVSRYVQLKKAGANHQGLCPFHTEKTPSFTVSPAKQFYHCFGCGAHGNAIGFLMAYSSLGYIDAIKELASSAGMQVPESRPPSPAEQARREREPDLFAVMEKAMAFYRGELKTSPRAIEYLKDRGVSGEIAARFGLGYAPDDWNSLKAAFANYEDAVLEECGLVVKGEEDKRYDRFRDRVMFPIFSSRGNVVIGFGGRVLGSGEPKYLNSPETPIFHKGREVYGLSRATEAIRAEGRVLVVEGYMDVIALAQHGIGYSVATLGTATTPEHVAKLLRLADELVFSFDGDAAGRKAAWRALEVSLPLAADSKRVRFLFLPEGEDPDTYVRRHGKDGFADRLREAQLLSEFLLGELLARNDVRSAEGRAKYLMAAKPHVQAIAAPGLKLQVVKEVARVAEVTQEEAERLLQLQPSPQFRRPAPPRAQAPVPMSTESQLLRWVVARPDCADRIDRSLLNPASDESRLLGLIAELGRDKPAAALTQSYLIEAFRGTEHEPALHAAQQYLLQLGIEDDAVEQEIAMCMLTLRIRRANDEVESLKQVVVRDPRDRESQTRLQAKVQELAAMKRQRGEGRPSL